MMKNASLPNLPGYKANMPLQPGDRKHYRKTTLTYLRGYAMDETPVQADIEPPAEPPARPEPPQQPISPSAVAPKFDSSKGPKWVQNDKKVLRWYGYFKEAVPGSPNENYRVRRIIVCHYLADDTTEVLEPKVVNSGLWQGSFIKRHQISRPDGIPYAPGDIRVGENLPMYGRVFRIVEADPFTRAHMSDQGISLAPAESYPVDPFESIRTANALAHSRDGKHREVDAAPSNSFAQLGRLQAYLLNSKKVLQFYCVWDDRQHLYGDRRLFRLHFYLEDHTTEILEVHEQNSGRDHFPVFLQRCQLPKDPEATKAGKNLDRKLCFGLEDFRIGTFVHIYGRDLFIHDCDEFTRRWYQENLGFTPEMMALVDISEPLTGSCGRTLPPYNGYGSLEDSAENCKHLIPKPPKKDFYKLINKGKVVLRFGAKFMDTPSHQVPEDHSQRQFVMSFFMADDSISVFEHPTDGFSGGKFLERAQVPKTTGQLGEILKDRDLYVGAKLLLHGHAFELYSSDEYTLQYMENNRHEYDMADPESALAAVKLFLQGNTDALRSAVVEVDRQGTGQLSVEALADVFSWANVPLSMHQVITIHRRLSKSSGSYMAPVQDLFEAVGL